MEMSFRLDRFMLLRNANGDLLAFVVDLVTPSWSSFTALALTAGLTDVCAAATHVAANSGLAHPSLLVYLPVQQMHSHMYKLNSRVCSLKICDLNLVLNTGSMLLCFCMWRVNLLEQKYAMSNGTSMFDLAYWQDNALPQGAILYRCWDAVQPMLLPQLALKSCHENLAMFMKSFWCICWRSRTGN